MDCQKHLFNIPEGITYLNSATMGVLPQRAEKIGHEAVTAKMAPWNITAQDFFTDANKACSLMAQMIESQPEDVIIIPSASYGISLAVKNLPLSSDQKIILLEDQFPSNVYPWQVRAKDVGAQIHTVTRPDNSDWTAALIAAIDDKTAIVACPAVHWTDGSLIDLTQVGQKCRAVGAALVVDLSQSLGMMPFSVKDVDPDFMVCVGYKWLMGPYSFSYAYVAPRHHGGQPLEENWIARKDSENFTALVDYTDQYQPGARRFDMGERSNHMLSPIAIDCLQQILEWGVDEISVYLKTLTDYAAKKARKLNLSVVEGRYRSPHFMGINFEGGVPEELIQSLQDHKIYVAARGTNIRVAPHVFNDKSDIDRLFAVIADFL